MDKYTFNSPESMAVARLVWVLIFSDGGIDRRESDFFEQVLQSLNMSSKSFEDSLSDPIEHVYEVVKAMSAKKRRDCVKLFNQAVSSDDVVVLSELSSLNEILEKTEIFRPDNKDIKKSEGGFL